MICRSAGKVTYADRYVFDLDRYRAFLATFGVDEPLVTKQGWQWSMLEAPPKDWNPISADYFWGHSLSMRPDWGRE